MAAEPTGARQLALHGSAGEAGGWRVRCGKQNAVAQNGKKNVVSNVQLVQHGSTHRSAQRWETYTQYTSKFKYMQC